MILILFFLLPTLVLAQQGASVSSDDISISEEMEEVHIKGHNLILPKGLKVTERGSHIIIGEMGEYTAKKFEELKSRLKSIEQKLEEQGKRIKELEEKQP